MQLVNLAIRDFRHIQSLDLDFTDSLGRINEITAIVGPNTSGKTTILDAIALSIGLLTKITVLRPGCILSPGAIVRRGAIQAKVRAVVHFSPEEVEATRQLFRLSGRNDHIPECEKLTIEWAFPGLDSRSANSSGHPKNCWKLFDGRATAAKLLSTRRADTSWFQKTGGVFTFDQQRTGMGKTIRRDIWEIIQQTSDSNTDDRYTTDPRTILLALAVQSQFPPLSPDQVDQFKLIQEKYNELCAPHRFIGAARNELNDLDIRFNTNGYEFGYEGLSSGEQMVLLFLIKMVTEHINKSIVLIDELELHHHPVWQRKLLNILPKIGIENQFIFTTHSPYLRDVMPQEAVIDLGDLETGHQNEQI
ncbi:MAG: AAA family ATPase [Deltaproteobacteria bacterium]|nr:AAA family ATPase [Deltaproteobacteria bacterium]MBF0525556.1 AAA family ATPase [Deltaproteobacteria bacterium]